MRPTPFLVTVVIIVAGGAIWLLVNPAAWQRRGLERDVQSVRREVQQLERRRDELQARRDALQSDPALLEREVRRQLGFVRPGEVALVPTPASAAFATDEGPRSWTGSAMIALLALLAMSFLALLAGCLAEQRRWWKRVCGATVETRRTR